MEKDNKMLRYKKITYCYNCKTYIFIDTDPNIQKCPLCSQAVNVKNSYKKQWR